MFIEIKLDLKDDLQTVRAKLKMVKNELAKLHDLQIADYKLMRKLYSRRWRDGERKPTDAKNIRKLQSRTARRAYWELNSTSDLYHALKFQKIELWKQQRPRRTEVAAEINSPVYVNEIIETISPLRNQPNTIGAFIKMTQSVTKIIDKYRPQKML